VPFVESSLSIPEAEPFLLQPLGQLTNLEFIGHSPTILGLFTFSSFVCCIIAGAMGNHIHVAASSLATSPVAEGLNAGHRWQDASSRAYVDGTFGRYRVRLAQDGTDLIAACRLRFNVFNLEMGEGLSSSYSTGLDRDRFDAVCDHLIVEDQEDGQVVGTYRMQSGLTACAAFGYYSAQEFEFAPYECIRQQVLELGRASIDRRHRSSEVLTLLWRGIAQYAKYHGLRYLIGCSSLNSKDPLEGWSLYRQLASQLVSFEYITVPTAAFSLPSAETGPATSVKVPKLLRTYLSVGARICGPPAWDRAFGTIDFLTLLDLEQITPAARSRFLTE
jgi:putative hemolysin